VLSLETQLAVSHRTPQELRDSELNYNKYNVSQLDQMMPNLDWHRILSNLTITNQTVLMSQPDYYQLLNKLIVNQPLNTWKNKIRFTILDAMSNYLSKDFVQARFNMFNHLINGQREDKSRWMKLIDEIEVNIGELLGQLYVSRYFSSQSKERTLDLVKNLIDVYHERINHIDWMKNSTKEKALRKLQKIHIKVGYPTKWKTYDGIHMNRSSYFDSMASVFQYSYRKKMNDLKKSVDRDEWFIAPQTVNAYYVRFY
jgi:putative endopeptidase